MNPFLFNSQERRLFGIYHPAVGQRRRRGAVICPPFGREYLMAHRACRLLAERICASGIDVLRFDYFGTGDSAGDSDEVSLAGCIEDTVVAIEEIKALAGVPMVAVIGLRLGGAIGISACGQVRGIDRLALWDPVVDGPAYLEELSNDQERPHSPDEFVKGFPLPRGFEAELRSLSIRSLPEGPRRNHIIASKDLPQYQTLLDHIGAVTKVEYEFRPSNPVWLDESGESGIVPMDFIEQIGIWMQ